MACMAALTLSAPAADSTTLPMAHGPYQPNMESLRQYQCPEWFRDAKFGIWAHWGPQAVPMMGDWYAKNLYLQDGGQYKHHLETYGHPSTNGYKDIIPLWKAEKFDPDRLMALYKKAGAKYFVSMGTHHDNFFLWDSKIHPWNAVNMGPHRDIVGVWQKAAHKQGLKFGVSEHLGASFTWFQPSHGADKTGPMAGVPYDGADPKYQDLYHFPAEPGDTGWYSNNPRWQHMWYDRIKELVDAYHPDLLYTDGAVPFGNEVGWSMIAHLYNASAARHHGRPEVIYTCKQKSEGRWVEDLERGVMPGINPAPWQTDTSIGDWYYNKNWKFRPTSWTIHMLVDIVSKNGNLLLNVVQKPDGSLDPEVEQALKDIAQWIKIHGEAIYGTRPWLVYGEGAVKAKGGHFKEDFAYTARDIRFTTKGSALYAIALGWPADGKLVVRSLARTAEGGPITGVKLLGYKGRVQWTQTDEGLIVTLPAQKLSEYTCAINVSGKNLKPAPLPEVSTVVAPDAQGNLVLSADLATLNGSKINTEAQGGQPNIGFWDDAADYAIWKGRVPAAGRYTVSVSTATVHAGAEFQVEIGGQKLTGKAPQTGSWSDFRVADLGVVELKQGEVGVKVGCRDPQSWKALNLRFVKLTKAAQ